jgi:hypothetical protein
MGGMNMLTAKVELASSLIGFGDIKQSIDGWEEFLHDGSGFLSTAKGAYGKEIQTFTPEILYNIIAMAIEKFVMAALMKQGALPYNHTMHDLVEAMEDVFPERIVAFKEGLLNMDSYQEICDVDAFNIIPPEREEISWMLLLAENMEQLAFQTTGEVAG